MICLLSLPINEVHVARPCRRLFYLALDGLRRFWAESERKEGEGGIWLLGDDDRRPSPLAAHSSVRLSGQAPVVWQREKINGQDFSARTRVRGFLVL